MGWLFGLAAACGQVIVGPLGENVAFITKLSSSVASGSTFYTDDGPDILERVCAWVCGPFSSLPPLSPPPLTNVSSSLTPPPCCCAAVREHLSLYPRPPPLSVMPFQVLMTSSPPPPSTHAFISATTTPFLV